MNLADVEVNDVSELPKIFDDLQSSDCFVRELDFSILKWEDSDIKALAEALKVNESLVKLDLGYNSISDTGAKYLTEALKVNKTLVTLDLGWNDISDTGAQYLAEALKVNKSLETLGLSWNDISDTGAQCLAEALKVNKTLVTLHLGSNSISATGAQHLAEALKVNKSLVKLDLSFNSISDTGVQYLAEALKVNNSLVALCLYSNNISDTGAQYLAEALKVNKSLVTLYLYNNKISDTGAQYLAEALEVNKSLVTLHLGSNSISDTGAQYLAEALKVNKSLVELDLYNNKNISYALIQNLLHIKNSPPSSQSTSTQTESQSNNEIPLPDDALESFTPSSSELGNEPDETIIPQEPPKTTPGHRPTSSSSKDPVSTPLPQNQATQSPSTPIHTGATDHPHMKKQKEPVIEEIVEEEINELQEQSTQLSLEIQLIKKNETKSSQKILNIVNQQLQDSREIEKLKNQISAHRNQTDNQSETNKNEQIKIKALLTDLENRQKTHSQQLEHHQNRLSDLKVLETEHKLNQVAKKQLQAIYSQPNLAAFYTCFKTRLTNSISAQKVIASEKVQHSGTKIDTAGSMISGIALFIPIVSGFGSAASIGIKTANQKVQQNHAQKAAALTPGFDDVIIFVRTLARHITLTWQEPFSLLNTIKDCDFAAQNAVDIIISKARDGLIKVDHSTSLEQRINICSQLLLQPISLTSNVASTSKKGLSKVGSKVKSSIPKVISKKAQKVPAPKLTLKTKNNPSKPLAPHSFWTKTGLRVENFEQSTSTYTYNSHVHSKNSLHSELGFRIITPQEFVKSQTSLLPTNNVVAPDWTIPLNPHIDWTPTKSQTPKPRKPKKPVSTPITSTSTTSEDPKSQIQWDIAGRISSLENEIRALRRNLHSDDELKAYFDSKFKDLKAHFDSRIDDLKDHFDSNR